MSPKTPQEIWTCALGELQLQMTKATFDTWLKSTQALKYDDGCFVIGVHNAFVKDWLENRLQTTIERTLVGIVDQPVRVAFLVTEEASATSPAIPKAELVESEGDVVAVKFYEFDPRQRGFLQIPKYDLWFWQPLLGGVAFATYQFLRSLDRQNEGWGEWRFVSVEEIAATVGVNRQAITGVQRRRKTGEKYWQPGAFIRLSEAAITRIETLGGGNKKVSYRISCLNHLPLMVPGQVETLPEVLQIKHAKFLKECSIEYEEWEQLTLPSLVQE